MNTTPRLLDVVALLTDVHALGLRRGQVGTVVELLDGAYEVEFADDEGKTYAELALPSDRLLVLHASISTTLNIYTHVVDASHRQAIEAVERQLFPTVPKSQEPDTPSDSVSVTNVLVKIGGAARI